jgi:hypothetical protein
VYLAAFKKQLIITNKHCYYACFCKNDINIFAIKLKTYLAEKLDMDHDKNWIDVIRSFKLFYSAPEKKLPNSSKLKNDQELDLE